MKKFNLIPVSLFGLVVATACFAQQGPIPIVGLVELSGTGANYAFSAGDLISVKVAPLGSCVFGSCGEELWYTPRSTTSVFTVAINSASRVSEPSLNLKWNDGGKRSVFVGRFGETDTARNRYVTMDDFCSAILKITKAN